MDRGRFSARSNVSLGVQRSSMRAHTLQLCQFDFCSPMKMKLFFLAFLVLSVPCHGIYDSPLSLYSNCNDIKAASKLMQLKEYLFCNYDERVRPTVDYRNATVVNFFLFVSKFDVDGFANIVDFQIYTRMTWTDSRLTWKPSEFDDILSLHVMNNVIWEPDIISHSVTDQDLDTEMPATQCLVRQNGLVLCTTSRMITTHCDSDHTWWPYDVLNCSLHFASWSHSTDEIDIRFDSIHAAHEPQLNLELYNENSAWNVVRTSVRRRVVHSKFELDFSTMMLSFNLLLKRHHTMHSVAYVTMTIVLMTMTLMAFWLEPRSTERMIIANLNFVLHLCCLQDIHWKISYNGPHTPKLLLFFENSLVLAAFSLILTGILRYMQELNTEAPVWVSSGTESILKSRVGQIFSVSILDPKVSASMEITADDNTNLVSLERRIPTWRHTSILIGWFAFFSVSLTYLIMLATLLPSSSRSSTLDA